MLRSIRQRLLGGGRKHLRHRDRRSTRRLAFEGLEGRQMMAAGIAAGTLALQDTADAYVSKQSPYAKLWQPVHGNGDLRREGRARETSLPEVRYAADH